MAHLGQTCGRYAAHISHSENCDIHRRSWCLSLDFASCGGRRDTSVKLCHLSRRGVPKDALVLPTHVLQERFVILKWIFSSLWHPSIEAEIIRMNVHQHHPAVFGYPVEFFTPNINRRFAKQEK